jgi:hypothetical protein
VTARCCRTVPEALKVIEITSSSCARSWPSSSGCSAVSCDVWINLNNALKDVLSF